MNTSAQNRITIFLLFTGILFAVSCANIGQPTGGEVDKTPPKLHGSNPKDRATNFSEKEIHFSFDEYILIKNASTEFISSPPLTEKPEIISTGKGFKVVLDEQLLPNTTYSFLFGNSITDNNEGNVLENFSYTFSTGDYLDSLEFEGMVKDAFSLKPIGGVFVGLYTSFDDSVVAKESPRYIAKTDSGGYFKLRALKDGNYKIFALRDLNNSLKYDLITEAIAFDENTVTPKLPAKKLDTVSFKQDSISKDSLTLAEEMKDSLSQNLQTQIFEMLLFPEESDNQSIKSSEFLEDGHVLIVAKKAFITPQIQSIFKEGNISFLSEFSEKKDSLNIWFLDRSIDSVGIELVDHLFKDTIMAKKGRSFEKKSTASNLLKSGIDNKIPFFIQPTLEFKNPIIKTDNELKARLITGTDTTNALFLTDSLKRKITLDFKFQEDSTYTLIIDSAYFTDIYKHVSHQLAYTFKFDNKENYGNFVLKFQSKNYNSQYIVQLLTDKNAVEKEYILKGNATLDFPHLKQGNYQLKVLEDKNENRLWDSGNYWQKRQPEKVRFFEKPINIRENWDLKETFIWEE